MPAVLSVGGCARFEVGLEAGSHQHRERQQRWAWVSLNYQRLITHEQAVPLSRRRSQVGKIVSPRVASMSLLTP